MIYFDANATSRMRQAVRRSLLALVVDGVGNPSSVHQDGRAARALVTKARRQVSELLFGTPHNRHRIVFTSGGTEACNSMVRGFLGRGERAHIICSAIEHPAVLEPLKELATQGCDADFIDAERSGAVDQFKFAAAVRKETALAVLMAANNETGALQPVAETAHALRGKGFSGAFVSDCSQALGKSKLDVERLFAAGVDAIAISAHKIGGPQGAGALVINGGACRTFVPLIAGGPQEGRLRAGTENVLSIASFGEAAAELLRQRDAELSRVSSAREEFWSLISASLPRCERLTPAQCLSNTLLVRFPGCRGDDLVVALDLLGLAASTGSACSSGKQEASYVVRSMGYGEETAREVVRFSLDWDCDEAQVREAHEIVVKAVQRMDSAAQVERPAVSS